MTREGHALGARTVEVPVRPPPPRLSPADDLAVRRVVAAVDVGGVAARPRSRCGRRAHRRPRGSLSFPAPASHDIVPTPGPDRGRSPGRRRSGRRRRRPGACRRPRRRPGRRARRRRRRRRRRRPPSRRSGAAVPGSRSPHSRSRPAPLAKTSPPEPPRSLSLRGVPTRASPVASVSARTPVLGSIPGGLDRDDLLAADRAAAPDQCAVGVAARGARRVDDERVDARTAVDSVRRSRDR